LVGKGNKPAIRLEQTLHIAPREIWLELTDLVGSQHIAADAALPSHHGHTGCPRSLRLSHRPSASRRGAKGHRPPKTRLVSARHEGLQRIGDELDPRVASFQQEADQPGCDLRQIAPTDTHRTAPVKQYARHVTPRAGVLFGRTAPVTMPPALPNDVAVPGAR